MIFLSFDAFLDICHHAFFFFLFPFLQFLLTCLDCRCILELEKTRERSSYAVVKFRILEWEGRSGFLVFSLSSFIFFIFFFGYG